MMLASLLKGLVVSISLMTGSQAASPAAAIEQGGEQISGQIAALPPEVRLRKLHLVRPDLIPFPISFEVYC